MEYYFITNSPMQQAIEEAKKMIEEKKAYRDAICTTGPEEEQLLSEEKVLQELIERLESKASLPEEPTTDELLEEFENIVIVKKGAITLIDTHDAEIPPDSLLPESTVKGKTPREALLALKEKLPVEKLYKRIEEITGVKCFKTKGEEKEFYNKLHYNQ